MKKQIYFKGKLQLWLLLGPAIVFLLVSPVRLESQNEVLGAEMRKEVSQNSVWIRLVVYRMSNLNSEIKIDWGDGTGDWVETVSTVQLKEQLFAEIYTAQHNYEEPGIYAIGFTDSSVVYNLANIVEAENQVFQFQDSVHVNASLPILRFNISTYPIGYMFGSYFPEDEEGVLIIQRSFQQQIDIPYEMYEELEAELVPFPVAGYSDPPGAEGIEVYAPDIGRARLVWDRPIEPGRYALCMKVNEYRDFEGARYFMSTNHFAFIVDVDEDMIVSTSSPSAEALPLQLFPNPTTSTLYLKAKLPSPAHSALLTVQDAMGRELLRQPLPAGSGQHELDVSAWPAGVYFLRLRQGEVEVVERFVKGE